MKAAVQRRKKEVNSPQCSSRDLNMLLGLQFDVLVRLSSYLAAKDICGLAETCRFLGASPSTADRREGASLANEISRRLFEAAAAREKASLLPKHDDEAYTQLYHRLLMLRLPLMFDYLIGRHMVWAEGDKSAVRVVTAPSGYDWNLSTAICLSQVMRSGRHFAQFTPTEFTAAIHVGIIRPIQVENASDQPIFSPFARTFMALNLQRTSRWGESSVDCCFYSFKDGGCRYRKWPHASKRAEWNAMERCSSEDTVGLLLDLDRGTLSVCLNERRLGVMIEGLAGEYCWSVTLSSMQSPSAGIKIERSLCRTSSSNDPQVYKSKQG